MSIKDRLQMQAGEYNKLLGYEEICLSPLPLPTGAAPYSQHLQKSKTSTYLDFGQSDAWHMEDGFRMLFTLFNCDFFIMFAIPLFLTWLRVDFSDPYFWSEYWVTVYALLPMSLSGFVFLVLLGIGVFAKAIWNYTHEYPLRFNRERREVCYIPPKGEPVFTKWENIIVTIDYQPVITAYSVTPLVNLNLAIIEPYARVDGVMGHTISYGFAHTSLALSEWEAIRHFMEYGMLDSPNISPPKPALEPTDKDSLAYGLYLVAHNPEGSPKFFDYEHRQSRKHDYFIYYIGLVLFHLLTYWKLPCYLAQWVNGLPTKAMPKTVQQWSNPLPKEQWAKPSQALLEQSAQLIASYRKGINFYQHFDIPFADS